MPARYRTRPRGALPWTTVLHFGCPFVLQYTPVSHIMIPCTCCTCYPHLYHGLCISRDPSLLVGYLSTCTDAYFLSLSLISWILVFRFPTRLVGSHVPRSHSYIHAAACIMVATRVFFIRPTGRSRSSRCSNTSTRESHSPSVPASRAIAPEAYVRASAFKFPTPSHAPRISARQPLALTHVSRQQHSAACLENFQDRARRDNWAGTHRDDGIAISVTGIQQLVRR